MTQMSCLMLCMGFLTERSAETTGKRNPGLETESAERTGKIPPVSGGTWKYSGSASQPDQTAATWPGGILQPEPGTAGMKNNTEQNYAVYLLVLKITFLILWHEISERKLQISVWDIFLIQNKAVYRPLTVLFCPVFSVETGKCRFLAGFGAFTSAQYNLICSAGGYGSAALRHCWALLKFQNPEWVFSVWTDQAGRLPEYDCRSEVRVKEG